MNQYYEHQIMCSVGLTTKGKEYFVLHNFLQNLKEKYPFVNEEEGSVYNEVTKFLGFK